MDKKAFIFIILSGIFWGMSGLFVRLSDLYLGFAPLQLTFFRAVVTFFCMFVFLLFKDKKALKVSLKEILFYIGSGLSFFGTAGCYFISMKMTSVSTAVVLMYTAPVFVMIYSVLFLGEKMTRFKFLSVVAMLIGCALVSGIVGGMVFDLLGIAIGMLSGISFSAYNILTKLEMKRGYNPVVANMYTFLFAAIIGMITCDMGNLMTVFDDTPLKSVLYAMSIGIVTSVLPYLLYTLALKKLPVGTASALGIVEPMSASIFSFMLLGEKPTVTSVCGIILISGAVILLSRSEEKG